MRSVFIRAIAGLIGGALAWVVTAPSAPTTLTVESMDRFQSWERLFFYVLVACIALSLGIASGLQRGSWMHVLREGGLGLIFGTIGGQLGIGIGAAMGTMLFPAHVEGMSSLPVEIAWRIIVLSPIGLGLGLGIGAAGLNVSRAIQGAIGGLLGGVIAAACFDLIGVTLGQMILASRGTSTGEVGGPSRAVLAIVLGLGIGLFIGIAERVMATAFVRLHLGRNEGREWVVDRPQFVLGRAELADVPITGDPSVMPHHAIISKEGDHYVLSDNNTPSGTYLDGARIQRAPLYNGAWIGIGAAKLQFLLRKASPIPAFVGPQGAGPDLRQTGYGQPGYGGPGFGQGGYPAAGYGPPGYVQNPGGPVPGGPMPGPYGGVPAGPIAGQPYNNPGAQIPAGFGGPTPSPSQGTPMSATMFKLTGLSGPLAGQIISMPKPMEIGREGADIRLTGDIQASRKHASFSPAPSGISIIDLGSTNGTFLNGQRVQNALAAPGDIIGVGGSTFRVDPA